LTRIGILLTPAKRAISEPYAAPLRCAATGFARQRAGIASMRFASLRRDAAAAEKRASRKRKYDGTIADAVTALWEASDLVCGKRLVAMIPSLLPGLERHGRLKLEAAGRERVFAISAATIDRLLGL